MKQWNWKKIALFIIAVPAVSYIAGCIGENTAQNTTERRASHATSAPVQKKIRVIVSSQGAGGITQKNLDLTFLRNLEAYTIKRIKVKTKERLASQGHPDFKINLTSEANYVEIGPMKLAVIRLGPSGKANQVFIAGVVGSELRRVLCVMEVQESIPITYGACAEKIEEVFGVKIGR